MNLQCDLLMLGKQVYTNISYTQQIQYIVTASQEDLIIIFSSRIASRNLIPVSFYNTRFYFNAE